MIFFYFHVNILSSIHFRSLIHVEHRLDLRENLKSYTGIRKKTFDCRNYFLMPIYSSEKHRKQNQK